MRRLTYQANALRFTVRFDPIAALGTPIWPPSPNPSPPPPDSTSPDGVSPILVSKHCFCPLCVFRLLPAASPTATCAATSAQLGLSPSTGPADKSPTTCDDCAATDSSNASPAPPISTHQPNCTTLAHPRPPTGSSAPAWPNPTAPPTIQTPHRRPSLRNRPSPTSPEQPDSQHKHDPKPPNLTRSPLLRRAEQSQ